MTLDLSFRYIPRSRMRSGTSKLDEVLTPKVDFENRTIEPDHHREISTLNLLVEAGFNIGLSPRWGMNVALPLFTDREHEHFDDAGAPTESFAAEKLTGFGDACLYGRFAAVVAAKDLLVAAAEVKLPTGAYRLRDAEGDIQEPTLQPGTGAADLMAGVYYARQWVPHRGEYFASGSYQRRGENPLDYRSGNLSLLGAGVKFSPNERVVVSLQPNGQAAPHDFYAGHLVPGTGSRSLTLAPGVAVSGKNGLGFYAHLVQPVYQDVNEEQLAPRTAFPGGVTADF